MLVSGGVVSATVTVAAAGDGSVLPALSMARTSRRCWPTDRAEYDFGDVQARKGAESPAASRRHSKVEPDSVDENVKEAVVPVTPAESTAVSGGVVSGGGEPTVTTSCGGLAAASREWKYA